MYRPLLIIALCLCFSWSAQSQTVLEDFEDGGKLTWMPLDGVYNGIVANPEDTTGRNPSPNVGSFKRGGAPFSLMLTDLDQPLDLSTNNQFSLQVNAEEATSVTLKLEGGDGSQNIEFTRNIPVGTQGRWVTYEFDFSAASAADMLDRVVIFFNIANDSDTSTYLFDNLIAGPAGPCTGVAADPAIIDDFECQRNIPVAVPGLDDITIVDNPDTDGNPSTTVARYRDTLGRFHALVYDNGSGIDLSNRNQVCLRVWAPVEGILLVKLEGGTSAPAELQVPITDLMQWKDYCVDFSDQFDRNHTRLVFFFNFENDAGENEIYFLDDIRLEAKPEVPALEDFEDGANLSWMPLNGDQATHGTFDGVIANPAPDDVNGSANIGSYTRAATNFSTLSAVLPSGIDLMDNPQINLDVWAPAGSAKVSMSLVSALEGIKTVEADLSTTEAWETLNFNFSEFNNITDFTEVQILFDPNTMGTDTYFFDNLQQGESTVDACAGVDSIPNVVDDFDCQRNIPTGTAELDVIRNPDPTAANSSTFVGQYTDPSDEFSALVYNFDTPIDLTTFNQVAAQIWSPAQVPLGFKLEGSQTGASDVEIVTNVETVDEWVTYQIDFSGAVGGAYTRLVIFFNFGQVQTEQLVYFIDNIEFRRAPFVNTCVSNFEEPELKLEGWNYFANGDFDGTPIAFIANPAPDAVNMTDSVAVFEEASNGETFAGAFADPVAPIVMEAGAKVVTLKVWMPVAGQFVLKLERPLDGATNIGDVIADYTTPNAWQELTFDFSPVEDGARYERVTIIPNFGVTPDMALTHYFDELAVGTGSCATTSIFEPIRVDRLEIGPNPADNFLRVFNTQDVHHLQILNTLGQPVRHIQLVGQVPQTELDLSGLQTGMYVLTAYDARGQLIANSTFIKK